MERKPPDRRVHRTETLLRDALSALIHEKSYDAIVVQEILDRADIGRSTFYSHFKDKDDLLQSGIREMLRTGPTEPSSSRAERIVRFSLPFLEHVGRRRPPLRLHLDAGGQASVHEHLRRVLAELIARDLRHFLRTHGKVEGRVPTDLLADHVAATFILVLTWWLGGTQDVGSKDAHEVFLALVLPVLNEALSVGAQQ